MWCAGREAIGREIAGSRGSDREMGERGLKLGRGWERRTKREEGANNIKNV